MEYPKNTVCAAIAKHCLDAQGEKIPATIDEIEVVLESSAGAIAKTLEAAAKSAGVTVSSEQAKAIAAAVLGLQ